MAVIEGRVEISETDVKRGESEGARSPTQLAAGEEASIVTDGRILTHAATDLAKTVAWRQRRLMFRLDTLADIATEFNRYNRIPKVRVQGDAARSRRFSGVFDADDPESLVYTLAGDETLRVERTQREIVIR